MSSIVSACYVWEGKTTSKKLDKFTRDYTLTIRVQASDGNLDHNTLLAYSSAIPAPHGGTGGTVTLPVIGTTLYATDSGALCTGVSVRQNFNTYDLTYTFSSNVPISQLRNQDPTARAPIYTVSFQKFQTGLVEDLDGTAILNSAGQPFEQVVATDRAFAVIEITKNYSSFLFEDLVGLENSVNDADWTPTGQDFTYPQYSCKMDSVSLTPKEENQTPYVEIKYRVLYNADLWHPFKVLDCGYCSLDDFDELVQMVDKYGAPLQKPGLLDGAGGQTATPTYLSFRAYELVNWSAVP